MSTIPSTSQLAAMQHSVKLTLVGYFLETILLGVFIVILGAGVWAIVSKKLLLHGRSRRDLVLLGACLLMSALVIWHVGIDMHIIVASGIMEGADVHRLSHTNSFLNAPNHFGKYKTIIYVLQTVIADGFMIYRAFMVWHGSWRVIAFPLFLLVSGVALGIATIVMGQLSAAPHKLNICTRAYFLITLATNVLATILVMRPLLLSRRTVREYRPKGSQLRTVRWRVMESILQSAAIFTISSLAFTVTQFTSPPGVGFCHHVFPLTIAISFNLTVARICLSPAEAPKRSMHGVPVAVALSGFPYSNAPGYAYGSAPLSRSRSHSCPSLPTAVQDGGGDGDGEGEDERKSACSHAGTLGTNTVGTMGTMGTIGTMKSVGLGRQIAIHVSVSTMQTSDRDLESGGGQGLEGAGNISDEVLLISAPARK